MNVIDSKSPCDFPVSPDFTFLELAIILKEHVEVLLDDQDEKDAVYLN